MEIHGDLAELALIDPEERDYNLRLQQAEWGAAMIRQRRSRKWEGATAPHWHLARELPVHTYKRSRLHECVIPFPSAPIYGINRKAEYGKSLSRPNMHTLRVLRRPDANRIDRLFILHNGLNEADDMKFHYRLADWILRAQESDGSGEGTACLIMPFPGHLTHFSFHGPFSETPLSRYLNDSGELFRQFLRYMVGMRWLLSIASDSDAEDWMVGGRLLKARGTVGDLAKGLFEESEALFTASRQRLKNTEELRNQEPGTTRFSNVDPGETTTMDQIEDTIRLLRSSLMRKEVGAERPLRTHVVGYSLGGFVAQSVFFAWPQVVSSCTTICSGGALSALSPTAFAHPEEWQAVLHSLRPELSNSMLQGRLGDDKREGKRNVPISEVAGMPLRRFGYFQRIFEQVFLQEDRGSYKERLSEYGLRMLFVSGGEDPIVPPTNILDASPEEGITMLSVAGMTHFLNQDPRGARKEREKEQRDFWLPEAGGLIARAAIRSENIHAEECASARKYKDKRIRKRPAPGGQPKPVDDTLTSSEAFESALDWVLDTVDEKSGWLLVCRNALPAAFINPLYFTRWGKGLHHHDVRIQQYAAGLRRRAQILKAIHDRTTLIVPQQLEHWFVHLTAQFDAHSDAPSGRMTTKGTRKRIWDGFEKRWWQCAREFNPAQDQGNGTDLDRSDLDEAMARWYGVDQAYLEVTHLPDVWIGIHPDSKSLFSGPFKRRKKAHEGIIDGVEQMMSGDKRETKTFDKDIENGLIRIVRVSGAEFNPRYRGQIERSKGATRTLLARSAAGLVRSTPMNEPGGKATAA